MGDAAAIKLDEVRELGLQPSLVQGRDVVIVVVQAKTTAEGIFSKTKLAIAQATLT